MNLDDWLTYIGNLHSSVIDLGLQRIEPISHELGLMKFPFPVIMVAGTNGKGSIVRSLESIYSAAGYKVGAYTSPHLMCFNERLHIAQQPVSDETWVKAFSEIDRYRDDQTLSFFEFTTLAALLICRDAALDVLLLEVGLGGRLDAVNIVHPDLSVISTIAIDHVDWLGEDREKIALEKAGIFRMDGKVICGDPEPPASLIRHAHQLNAQLLQYGSDYHVFQQGDAWYWKGPDKVYRDLPQPSLKLQNVATAMMAVESLGLAVPESALIEGIQQATLPGRYEIFECDCKIILDVAHNPQAAIYLAERLKNEKCLGKIFAVVGVLADKDIPEILSPFHELIQVWWLVSLDLPRGAKSQDLMSFLDQNACQCYTAESVSQALQSVFSEAQSDDIVLVFGSFHMVSRAKRFLETERMSCESRQNID